MASQELRPELLEQRWIHSHEEDTPTEMVFRPASFDFPRSRGRSGFDLRPDKSLVEIGIAPTDAPIEQSGKWDVGPDGTLRFYTHAQTVPAKTLKISSVEPSRLVVKR
jgi:hypothetical protein